MVVKTKNRFYDMRGVLDQLEFDVVKYEPNTKDNRESKVYLSKRLAPHPARLNPAVLSAGRGEADFQVGRRTTTRFAIRKYGIASAASSDARAKAAP